MAASDYTPEQQRLIDAWEFHMKTEFLDHDASAAADTMTPDAHGNHVAVITGGAGLKPAEKGRIPEASFSGHMATTVSEEEPAGRRKESLFLCLAGNFVGR